MTVSLVTLPHHQAQRLEKPLLNRWVARSSGRWLGALLPLTKGATD